MATRATALPPEERRAAIVAATLPLLLERGANVSTRQIAEAAGVAEGTIFAVFRDKDAVVQAVLQAALDPAHTDGEIAAIDRSLPFEEQLIAAVQAMQSRMNNVWRLLSSAGDTSAKKKPPADFAALADIFSAREGQLRTDAVTAARQLRTMTIAMSSPVLFAGDPMTPEEIVTLYLDGIRLRSGNRQQGGNGR